MEFCYKTSNNIYNNLPPRMSDGRHFTDYRSNCLVNNLLSSNNQSLTSEEFKNFMIDNANKLREINRTYIHQKNGTGISDYTCNIPAKYKIICNKFNCQKILVNPNGYGTDIENGTQFDKTLDTPVYIPNKCCNNINFRY